MDGALTTQPMALAVPPVRSTSASSMQSPPARADATSVITLSPVLARPGARPRSRCRSTSSGRPRCRPSVAGRISPALATRRWSSKAIWMRSGWSSASIFWVLLAWGRFPVSKAIIPDAQEHFLTPSAHRDTHLFGGLGLMLGQVAWYLLSFWVITSPWCCGATAVGVIIPDSKNVVCNVVRLAIVFMTAFSCVTLPP